MWIIIDEERFTEGIYPFPYKPIFSILGSIIEFSRQKQLISLLPDDSIRNLLGFNENLIFAEYNLSPNPVDILSSENNFFGSDILMESFLEENEVEKFIILSLMLMLVTNTLINSEEEYNGI